jgi:hypothetical protein
MKIGRSLVAEKFNKTALIRRAPIEAMRRRKNFTFLKRDGFRLNRLGALSFW